MNDQHTHHYPLSQYKPSDHHNHQPTVNSNHNEKHNKDDEPNNNSSKNTSSASSYDDTIDYDDSIQNHDIKETSQILKKNTAIVDGENLKYKCNDYLKSFPSRNPYEDQQQQQQQQHQQAAYNGTLVSGNSNEDYRLTSMDDRKVNEDGNSNDMRMNYASSDDMNQNTASSDHGEKLNSGSEDEGRLIVKFVKNV